MKRSSILLQDGYKQKSYYIKSRVVTSLIDIREKNNMMDVCGIYSQFVNYYFITRARFLFLANGDNQILTAFIAVSLSEYQFDIVVNND